MTFFWYNDKVIFGIGGKWFEYSMYSTRQEKRTYGSVLHCI